MKNQIRMLDINSYHNDPEYPRYFTVQLLPYAKMINLGNVPHFTLFSLATKQDADILIKWIEENKKYFPNEEN